MRKNNIKIMTDSASDIPAELERELDIKILPFPITIGDEGFHERIDFTNKQFYDILLTTQKTPVTSQITQLQFYEEFLEVANDGYNEVIYVSINSSGSNTHNSALMGRDEFYGKHGKDKLTIHIIDSKTYTIAYGYAVIRAAKKVQKGVSSKEIIAYLKDWFDSVEIYFAPYTLEFIKKSGRISCVSAFVGELVGLRPIISIIDGVTTTVEKVRGDRAIVPALAKHAKENAVPSTPYIVIKTLLEGEATELYNVTKKTFPSPAEDIYEAGAAITINAGPKTVGIVVKGNNRSK